MTWTYLEQRWGGGRSYDGIVFSSRAYRDGLQGEANKRGYLFRQGRDAFSQPLETYRRWDVGDKLDDDLSCEEVIAELQKRSPIFYYPYQARARRVSVAGGTLGASVLCLDSPVDVCYVACGEP